MKISKNSHFNNYFLNLHNQQRFLFAKVPLLQNDFPAADEYNDDNEENSNLTPEKSHFVSKLPPKLEQTGGKTTKAFKVRIRIDEHGIPRGTKIPINPEVNNKIDKIDTIKKTLRNRITQVRKTPKNQPKKITLKRNEISSIDKLKKSIPYSDFHTLNEKKINQLAINHGADEFFKEIQNIRNIFFNLIKINDEHLSNHEKRQLIDEFNNARRIYIFLMYKYGDLLYENNDHENLKNFILQMKRDTTCDDNTIRSYINEYSYSLIKRYNNKLLKKHNFETAGQVAIDISSQISNGEGIYPDCYIKANEKGAGKFLIDFKNEFNTYLTKLKIKMKNCSLKEKNEIIKKLDNLANLYIQFNKNNNKIPANTKIEEDFFSQKATEINQLKENYIKNQKELIDLTKKTKQEITDYVIKNVDKEIWKKFLKECEEIFGTKVFTIEFFDNLFANNSLIDIKKQLDTMNNKLWEKTIVHKNNKKNVPQEEQDKKILFIYQYPHIEEVINIALRKIRELIKSML